MSKKVNRIIKIIIGFLIILLILKFANMKDVIQILINSNWIYSILILFIFSFILFLRAIRFRLILQNLKYNLTVLESLKIIVANTFVIAFIPKLGGDFFRSYYISKYKKQKLGSSIGVIFVERILDTLVPIIFVLFFMLYFLININISNNLIILIYIAIFIVLLIIIISILIITNKRLSLYCLKIIKKVSILFKISLKYYDFLKKHTINFQTTIKFLIKKKNLLIKSIILTIFIWLFQGIQFYYVIKILDLEITLINSIGIYLIAAIIWSISMIPFGLGAMEGIITTLLYALGISYNQSVAIALISRLFAIIKTFLCGIIFYIYSSKDLKGRIKYE
jgi:glycosyltransferase 2 family protein